MLRLLTAHWRLKLGLTAALNAVFWTGYITLGRHAFFPLREVPLTAIDRLIPFQPEPWAWVYLSQFLFSIALPWLLTSREALHRYTAGLLLMSLTSFIVFFFFPTPGPRPAVVGDSFAMRFIATADGHLNALPSLHAGFLAFMGLLAWKMFGARFPRRTAAIIAIWGGSILYATLATKQHYALDLLAGVVVGVLAHWLAWRGAAPDAAAVTIPRSVGITSHAGIR